ncbi:MAG: TldD/PmbA family protein [Candidatus Eremiobacterota bacterium]
MQNLLNDTIKKYRHLCDHMEIRIEESRASSIFLGTDSPVIKDSIETGCNIRVLVKGSYGFTYFNDLNLMDEFAGLAIEDAKKPGRGHTVLAPVLPVIDIVKSGINMKDISKSDKIKILQNYNHIILNYDREKIKKSLITYLEEFRKKYFASSEGTYIEEELLDLNYKIGAIAAENGKTGTGAFVGGSTGDFSILYGLEEKVEKACRDAIVQLDGEIIKGGVYTVLCDQEFSGVFAHEAFGHNCEADCLTNEDTKKEMATGRIIGNKILNVYDTPYPGARGYMKYDDEGVETKKVYLIKEGVLAGKLHTRETAAMFNEEPAGSARAINYRFPPICRMRTTCIEAGKSTFSDMIKDIKKGVYVSGNEGGRSGETFIASPRYAYIIRNGEIAEPVKGVKITGNIFKTLQNIDMIGQDFQIVDTIFGCAKNGQYFLPVSKGAPHIRIQDVTIGGTI